MKDYWAASQMIGDHILILIISKFMTFFTFKNFESILHLSHSKTIFD